MAFSALAGINLGTAFNHVRMGFMDNFQIGDTQPDEVQYVEGVEGIKRIYEDMLETGADIFCWTDSSTMYEILPDYIPEWVARRTELGITSYAIMPKNETNDYYSNKKEDDRTCVLVDGFEFSGQIRVYGDKVALMTFNGDQPYGFVLRGEKFVALFKSIFDIQWNHLD